MEHLLTGYGADGRRITAPLVGAYELRHADAHLPASDLSEALALLQVRDDGQFLQIGKGAIRSIASAIQELSSVIAASTAAP